LRAAAAPPHPLSILILGGTSFLGPHQVAYALGRGHRVSIFTRGRTQPTVHKALFREVEHLVGDRADDLTALEGRRWDAVIDNSGRQAAWTRDSARLLADHVGLYLYTSSTGVYYPYLGSDIGEDQELVLQVPEGLDEIQSVEYGYGVMKARSEIEARRAFGDGRTVVVRPTYMMGPADQTDRFPYWPVRLDRGGEIMIPGTGHDPVQYVDGRDVAGFMIRLLENGTAGTFNAAGPASTTGMHQFVFGAHAAFSSAASWVMIPDYDFLEAHGVPYAIPWIMPVGENYGSARVDISHAVANGLTFRPLAESCRDILDWWYSDAVTEERRQNMVAGEGSLMAREPEIIAAWKAR
jgi:2'-hydroxyisoflavone reductase